MKAVDWLGFLGAWLLVAGPIYQAALELEEEDFDRDEMAAATQVLPERDPVSPWWWLIPPIAYLMWRRRREERRRELLTVLDAAQLERLMHFSQTAVGWLYVAGGASLIAVKETDQLRQAYAWSAWVTLALIVVMPFICAANTVYRVRRRNLILATAPARD